MQFLTDLQYQVRPSQRALRSPKLLIVFHGQGDTLEPYLSLPEELDLSEFNYLFLEAPLPYEGGFQWGRDHRLKFDLARLRQSMALLFLDLFSQGYRPQDLFLFGLSQGAMVVLHLMMSSGFSFGGVVAVSGYSYFARDMRSRISQAALQTPFLMTHGKRDREIPLAIGFRHFNRLQRLGFQGEWWEFDKGHVIDDRVEGPLIGQWLSLQSERQQSRTLRPSFEETFVHAE